MNITLCHDLEVCLKPYMESTLVAISSIVLTVNILHMIFLSHLKQQKGTVFYKIVRLVTCCDIMSSLLCSFTSSCLWRQAVEFSVPYILYVRSFFTFFSISIMYSIYLFSIADRWLMLARPFEYEHHFFIRNFTKVVFSAVINGLVSTPIVFVVQYYISGDFPCYDTEYGVLFCHPSNIHICLSPILLVNLLIITFAVLFFIEYTKMRKRLQANNQDARENRQAADYVCLSTSSYLLSSVLWIITVCFILSGNDQFNHAIPLFKSITMLVYQLNGFWNVLALYAVMDTYRKKLKEILSNYLIRGRNVVRVAPALDASHTPTA